MQMAASRRWACRWAGLAFEARAASKGLCAPLSPRLRALCLKPHYLSCGAEASKALSENANVFPGSRHKPSWVLAQLVYLRGWGGGLPPGGRLVPLGRGAGLRRRCRWQVPAPTHLFGQGLPLGSLGFLMGTRNVPMMGT